MKTLEGYFKGYRNFELFYQSWTPESPKGTMVITHGLGEHSECYERLVHGIQDLGLKVYGWDLRGHGRSDGRRGDIQSFDELSFDLMEFFKFVRTENKTGPYFLLGHSMGGLITLNALRLDGEKKTEIFSPDQPVVLSSPLLAVAHEVPALKLKVGDWLYKMFPHFMMSSEIQYEDLSRDEAIVKSYGGDPLRHENVSLELYFGMLKTMELVLAAAPELNADFYIQQAGFDRIVSAEKTQSFFHKLNAPNKEMHVYDGYFHEIYNDLGRDQVFMDLKKWLQKRLR